MRTSRYRDWIKTAGWEIKAQVRGCKVPGKFEMTVWLPPGVDLDNGLKAIPDLLGPGKHGLGITEDDKHMVALHVYRYAERSCRVELKGIPSAPPPAADEPPLPLGLPT